MNTSPDPDSSRSSCSKCVSSADPCMRSYSSTLWRTDGLSPDSNLAAALTAASEGLMHSGSLSSSRRLDCR
eukprot:3705641-Amphidinium_carterae.3